MFKRCRARAVLVAALAVAAVPSSASAAQDSYVGGGATPAPLGPYYGWSAWVPGHFGYPSFNAASVSGWPMCVTAVATIGGTEIPTGSPTNCSTSTPVGYYTTIKTKFYCGCQGTSYIRPLYTTAGPTGQSFILWARDTVD